jgi:heme-degrading monooxygenase HmoA
MFEMPYYAVIFSSCKKLESKGYDQMAERMEKLSASHQGFLGVQSLRGSDGFGITISYWKSLEDIKSWKMNFEHQEAQREGKASWYSGYEVRICKVERQYSFGEI